MMMVNSGMVLLMMEAIPESTYCSPQEINAQGMEILQTAMIRKSGTLLRKLYPGRHAFSGMVNNCSQPKRSKQRAESNQNQRTYVSNRDFNPQKRGAPN